MNGLIKCRPIRIHYFLRIPNIGDLINPTVVSAIAGEQTVHVGTDIPHLLAIGSVMSVSTTRSHVWGTGVMHPDIGVGTPTAARLHAVRGKLTHGAIRDQGIAISDVPLGDPGFIAPTIFGITRSPTPKYRLGVVPHYVDRTSPLLRRLLSVPSPDVVDLNVHQDAETFLRGMANCSAVISSSLHGLIFAEALGIPNLWVKASEEIAGGTFKFDDWFTTTAIPQRNVHVLTAEDSVDGLIDRATMHESTIDVPALRAAFPHQALEELREDEPRPLLPTNTCRTRPTPVFLISFNRAAMLERTIKSIKQQSRSTELVVHDNGSTDPNTIGLLDSLERIGTGVVRYPPLSSADDLNRVNETVQSYFSEWAEPQRYVVSDCDIDMAVAAPEALDVYDELLNAFRRVESVGPMLRISDIPETYPLFNRVMNRHIKQFWRREPLRTETSFGHVAYIDAMIDTTLAMHRAGDPFFRLKRSLRVYEPYEAQHLDWYLETIDDTEYAITSGPQISHWSNIAAYNQHKDDELMYHTFYAVKVTHSGALEVYKQRVTPAARMDAPIKPFDTATEKERDIRIMRTEAMRGAKVSDVRRWQSTVSHYPAWQERGRVLVDFIRPGERVFEFGAGNSAVLSALPPTCMYAGSDLAPTKDGIIVFDLNAANLPPVRGYDVALFSGVLEYVHDMTRLAAFLSRYFRSVVCSYAPLVTPDPSEIAKRRYSGWFSDHTVEEFSTIFETARFSLVCSDKWNGQALFRWDRRPTTSLIPAALRVRSVKR